jgi:hypothetical protein
VGTFPSVEGSLRAPPAHIPNPNTMFLTERGLL